MLAEEGGDTAGHVRRAGSSMRDNQPWKTHDKQANKSGAHHTIYWVRRNEKFIENRRLGLARADQEFCVGNNYTGDWVGNKKEGFGTFTWANGSKYEGEWLNDERHGKGTFWVRDGKKLRKQYTGDWMNNTRHGLGIFFYINGDKYEGEWRGNMRYGRGKMMYVEGSAYEGDWVEDKRSGLGVVTFVNKDRFEGHWLDDLKEGPGRFFYHSTRKLYEGEWMADVPKCGVYKDAPGSRFDIEYTKALDFFQLPELGLEEPELVVTEAIAGLRQDRAAAHGGDVEVMFNATEMAQLRAEFDLADREGRGVIICADLPDIMMGLGAQVSDEDIEALLGELQADRDTEITFPEFVDIMALLTG